MAKAGDQCPDCDGELAVVTANEPWNEEHLQCLKCDGTFVTEENNGKS